MHPFYTLESETPCAAGYDLICAAKLVIDPVRQMVWSYWHVDLYATPPQPPTLSLLPVSAHTLTTSTSAADKWLADCIRLEGLDPSSTVELPSTDPSQRPCAAMSPNTHPQSPSTLLPSLSAYKDAPVSQQLDNPHQNSIRQIEADTPTSSSDPLDDICSQVPEHIQLLFHTTVQANHLFQSLATSWRALCRQSIGSFEDSHVSHAENKRRLRRLATLAHPSLLQCSVTYADGLVAPGLDYFHTQKHTCDQRSVVLSTAQSIIITAERLPTATGTAQPRNRHPLTHVSRHT